MPPKTKGAEDPRRARSRTAMLEAALGLLASDGPTAVTPARVAAAAGVHRATAYRLWSDAEGLLSEVMAEAELPFFREPTAPVRDWLRARLRELADDLLSPASRGTTSTLMQASAWDPQIATRRDALVGTLEARLDAAQRMAVGGGPPPRRATRLTSRPSSSARCCTGRCSRPCQYPSRSSTTWSTAPSGPTLGPDRTPPDPGPVPEGR